MSINSLTNAALARRTDMVPQGIAPVAMGGTAGGTAIPPKPVNVTEAMTPAQANTALDMLFIYIPTEVLTLYVAVLAAVKPANVTTNTQNAITTMPTNGQWIAFWAFLIATPIVVWLVYAAKVKPLPIAFRAWPVWEILTATLAYFAWALALPGSPFGQFSWYSPPLASVLVLVTSTALSLLAPFFKRPINVES